jgi:hypothetical protein
MRASRCYRLSRLACVPIRCRLRSLTDRRRLFIGRAQLLNLGQIVPSRGPVNCSESRKLLLMATLTPNKAANAVKKSNQGSHEALATKKDFGNGLKATRRLWVVYQFVGNW